MGHEYSELNNYHAAIESYRRAVGKHCSFYMSCLIGAVDVNKRDHRAWYGLGQAYIFLGMHHYALYYLRRASLLRYASVSLHLSAYDIEPEIHRYGKVLDHVSTRLDSK